MLSAIATWADMVKFSHSIFALPFSLIGAVLAARRRVTPASWVEFGLIVGCMVAARSFAMTFNRLADEAYDRRNPRTAMRPLPTGRIERCQASAACVLMAVLFVILCGGFWLQGANAWPLVLGPIVLAYLAGYSYAKRFTSLSHLWLGIAIASAPAAAWIAIDPGSLHIGTGLLVAAAASWIAGFDIIYACQDVEVDRREGLHSLPARVGVSAALWISRACHVLTIAALAALPLVEPLGQWYGIGVGITAALLVLEQSLVRAGDLSRVNVAFFTINGIVGLVFGSLTILDVALGGCIP